MPGPVFAVTVTKSYRSPFAGSLVALGHGIVEIPLMLLIFFGLAAFLKEAPVKFTLGIVGGLALIYLGASGFRARIKVKEELDPHYHPVLLGIITTLFNPFFIIWWATVGAALIMKSLAFGSLGFQLFIPAHWLCDLAWLSFVSVMVYKTKHLWGAKAQQAVSLVCSLMLIGFGLWFILSTLL